MWDQRYAEDGFAYGTEPNDWLREVVSELAPAPGRALCLAEGEGRNAVWLAERGWSVVAVDQSAVGLEKARQLAASRGVSLETQAADLAEYALPEAEYALVVSIWAHLPPALRRRVHAQVVRALRPGGLLVLEAYSPDNVGRGVGGPQDPAMCMRLEDLAVELAGLEVVRAAAREREVQEGRYHRGLSAVTQLVARRP